MSNFHLKKDDLRPALAGFLKLDNGSVAVLTGATVTFSMRLRGSINVPKIDAAAVTIIDELTGSVEYRWTGTDTNNPGTYDGAFKISLPGAKPQTHPNRGFLTIEIEPSVQSP